MNPNSTRRKLAIASWSEPREGNIYGKLTVDATEALAYVDWLRARTGERITITHVVGKAVAMALLEAPGLNGVIRFGRFVPHTGVDIAYLVALEEGADLAKAKVTDAHRKSVAEICKELGDLARKLHKGEDEQFKKSTGPLKWMPSWLIRPVVYFTGWLAGVLGMSIPALGVERYPFGGAIITNVGVFGLDEGFAPPTPWAHVPTYVLVGAVRDQPTVVDGQVVVRKQLAICATIDHRFMDGAQGGRLAKVVRKVMENPWTLEGLDGRPADAVAS
ncbi:MAG: 2-oxo acid dehydrogenase subunit E2 [Alphaproteobacteria bacterium]|nr:2-oxo acid dehydrogenase subunit E2 [Alphaproteobacteria bacterium]MCB9695189.1 2-oxo acid dehydrogenase subunit E2 [Alphaproteobacteria bacterium]